MSSDRPGWPADVDPEGEDPRGIGSGDGASRRREAAAGDTAPIRPAAGRRRHRVEPEKKGSLLRELPVLLLVAFVLALLVKTFLVQAFFIPSGSMEQTLHGCPGCTGDRVLVNKVPYWFGEPEPGDIVVFEGPDTWSPEVDVDEPTNWLSSGLLWLGRAVGVAPPSEDDFVKRVIATEGQEVACCDPAGRVTVDGQPLEEPYVYEDTPLASRAFESVVVPEDRLWVMGDHRSASADSRSHIGDQYSGTVGVDDVIGKAAIIVWPLDRFGLLGSPDIQGVEAAAGAAGNPGGAAVPDTGAAAVAAPYVLGLVGTVPMAAWRRRRRAGRPRRPRRAG